MIRLAWAIAAGTVFTAIVAFCADAVAGDLLRVFPFMDLTLAFPYGICGGLLAARLAPGRELWAGMGVGLLTVLLGVISYGMNSGAQGGWFWTALTASLAGGAIFGSHLRAIQMAKRQALNKRKARKLVK